MSYAIVTTNNEYLAHHGILGQKWGVRRYQNPDGSLTKAGRKRYGEDLDINDKSRQNIAKIRTGEAKRRLDIAKINNPTNTTRIAELQGRVRSAKRTEKEMKKYDKGAALAAKGQTITGNNRKKFYAYMSAYVGSAGLNAFLNMRMAQLAAEGRWTSNHTAVAKAINKVGSYSMYAAATAYSIKKTSDNNAMRSYSYKRLNGDNAIKRVGSTEYADVVNRRKK